MIKAKVIETTVYIDSDPTTLGPDATASDLATYAEKLEQHLETRFPGRAFDVVQRLGGGPSGNRCPADDEIAEYVSDLEQGDGWSELLA